MKIKETTYIGKDSINSLRKDPKYNSLPSDTKKSAEDELKQGNTIKLGEMARLAIGYKLEDDNLNTNDYQNQKMSGVSLKDILDYIRENPGSTMKQVQTQFSFKRPQMVQALFTKLLASNIIKPFTHGGEEISFDDIDDKPVNKKTLSNWTDKEDMFVGPYFDDEDFIKYGSDDEDSEPSSGDELPSLSTLSTAKEIAVDFFMNNERLFNKLIDAWSNAKKRIKEVSNDGGLSSSDFRSSEKNRKDKAVDELPNLINLFVDKIKEIEDEEAIKEILKILNKKIASVGYNGLTKRIVKQLGIEIPKEDEPESENERLDENLIFRMKYLANIIQ